MNLQKYGIQVLARGPMPSSVHGRWQRPGKRDSMVLQMSREAAIVHLSESERSSVFGADLHSSAEITVISSRSIRSCERGAPKREVDATFAVVREVLGTTEGPCGLSCDWH
jgi:hypothetical protein